MSQSDSPLLPPYVLPIPLWSCYVRCSTQAWPKHVCQHWMKFSFNLRVSVLLQAASFHPSTSPYTQTVTPGEHCSFQPLWKGATPPSKDSGNWAGALLASKPLHLSKPKHQLLWLSVGLGGVSGEREGGPSFHRKMAASATTSAA
jgi:hypothetical protein